MNGKLNAVKRRKVKSSRAAEEIARLLYVIKYWHVEQTVSEMLLIVWIAIINIYYFIHFKVQAKSSKGAWDEPVITEEMELFQSSRLKSSRGKLEFPWQTMEHRTNSIEKANTMKNLLH